MRFTVLEKVKIVDLSESEFPKTFIKKLKEYAAYRDPSMAADDLYEPCAIFDNYCSESVFTKKEFSWLDEIACYMMKKKIKYFRITS